jgi:uncharacterized membrane-anchored protein
MKYFKIILLALVLCCLSNLAVAQENKYHPTFGPQKIKLGDNIASVDLSADLVFFDKNDTKKLFEEAKEPYDDSDQGVIMQKGSQWFALYRYAETGYIKDDDADKLDADDLLTIMKKNTEETNKKRKELGSTPIQLVGWAKPPSYNRVKHILTWSVIVRDDNSQKQVLNYSSVVLGRYGILICTVVDDYNNASLLQPKMDELINATSFTQGRKYEQWVQGDKISDIAMTGLITGGAAAAAYGAAKMGLLAKLGKFLLVILLFLKKAILLIFIPIGVFLKKLWNRLTGRATG